MSSTERVGERRKPKFRVGQVVVNRHTSRNPFQEITGVLKHPLGYWQYDVQSGERLDEPALRKLTKREAGR